MPSSCKPGTGQQRGASGGQKKVQIQAQPEQKPSNATQNARRNFPKFEIPDHEMVMLFIRARQEYVQRLKNACARVKRIVENHCGDFIGIAEDVGLLEGDQYRGLPPACILMIKFDTMKDCERWYLSDPCFKQHDFPTTDEIEMFAVPMKYLPAETSVMKSFLLMEMCGRMVSPNDFEQAYVHPVTKILDKSEIYHGVLATEYVKRIRNCRIRPNTFIVLSCAENQDKLRKFYNSDDYAQHKMELQTKLYAETDTCLYTVNPVMQSRG